MHLSSAPVIVRTKVISGGTLPCCQTGMMCTCVCKVCLRFYILATSKVITEWIPILIVYNKRSEQKTCICPGYRKWWHSSMAEAIAWLLNHPAWNYHFYILLRWLFNDWRTLHNSLRILRRLKQCIYLCVRVRNCVACPKSIQYCSSLVYPLLH